MALTIESVGQRFWVGPDAGVRLNVIVALIARLAGSAPQIERVDLPALPGDTLAPVPQATIPGWSQSISLEEGVSRMIEAYRGSG
jgi:nucleoside-diphosphate-sugar epimerase